MHYCMVVDAPGVCISEWHVHAARTYILLLVVSGEKSTKIQIVMTAGTSINSRTAVCMSVSKVYAFDHRAQKGLVFSGTLGKTRRTHHARSA